tara:strand:- start:264 stop:404 length:141 start_codon:yes stop_codon:yes gene_type:complete
MSNLSSSKKKIKNNGKTFQEYGNGSRLAALRKDESVITRGLALSGR